MIICLYVYIAVVPKDVTCTDMTVAIALNGVHIKSLYDDLNLGMCAIMHIWYLYSYIYICFWKIRFAIM